VSVKNAIENKHTYDCAFLKCSKCVLKRVVSNTITNMLFSFILHLIFFNFFQFIKIQTRLLNTL
jgi:hypothetical protein